MRILQINTNDMKGGAAKVAWRLQEGVRERGHTAQMLVGKKYSRDDQVHLIRPYSRLRERIYRKLSYWLANDLDLFPSGHILRQPYFTAADIIHCHNLHSNFFNLGILPKMAAQKPLVWTLHDMWPITAHCAHSYDEGISSGFWQCPALEGYPPIAWHNEKYLENKKRSIYAQTPMHIVVPSHWLKEKVEQSILRDKPIQVIYNGIDTRIFKPMEQSAARRRLDLPQDKIIILFLAKRGQSNPGKGGQHAYAAMDALAHEKNLFFIDLGGDEDARDENILRKSFVTNEETLAAYYAAADIFLYPWLAESFGLVVAEALACGLPVVSFAAGALPELVDHQKTGYIARYADMQDLISGIRWLLGRSEYERRKMRDNAVAKISSGFTIDHMTRQYIELYEKLYHAQHRTKTAI